MLYIIILEANVEWWDWAW